MNLISLGASPGDFTSAWMSMFVTFLGTSSGGGPTESRNCSSLVCDMLADQSLWMVDCAEGTARQFALQPQNAKPHLRPSKITKIFITHMHADHVMGIVPFLRNVLYAPSSLPQHNTGNSRPKIELYGPAGLRLFVRQIMKMTLTRTSDKYVVHELLTADDSVTPCDPPSSDTPSATHNIAEPNVLHSNEVAGQDIRASPDGLWHALTQGNGKMCQIIVNAGPILHRDPCIGYVFAEVRFPFRKLVILGDTYNPEAMIPLCLNPPPSLLIHEATDSHISPHADPSGKLARRSPKTVLDNALSKGHSVPEMAGSFAKRISAAALVLNHIGGRFPAPRNPRDHGRLKIIRDIEKKASMAWGAQKHVTAAWDFMRVEVPVTFIDVLPNRAVGAGTGTATGPATGPGAPPAIRDHIGESETHAVQRVQDLQQSREVVEAEEYVELECSEITSYVAANTHSNTTASDYDSAGPSNRKRRR